MTDPVVGVIFRRNLHPSAKALADLQDEAERVLCDDHLPLSEALERRWEQDAHLILYRVDADEKGDQYAFARVSKRSPFVEQLIEAGGRVRVSLLMFDHDLPKYEGNKRPWFEGELDEFVQKLAQLPSLPSPTAFYTTLHGSRFIYVLTKPVDHLAAEAMALGMIQAFSRADIQLDIQCTDWTRLFRLPRTVRADSGGLYEPELFITDGPLLDPADCPRAGNDTSQDRFAEVVPYEGRQPDPDEVRALLTYAGANGRVYDAPIVKIANQYLQGRMAHAICFANAPLVQGEENWNNQVTKVVGQVVGMLARQDDVTPEGIYAVLHSAIEQLQDKEHRGANQTNWFDVVWSLVCRMWANEEAQILAEVRAREQRVADGREQRVTMVRHLREALPGQLPEDDAEAEEMLLRRMIASDGRNHYIMRKDNTYNIRPVPDSLLVPMIRELDMEEVIPTTEMRGKNIVPRSSTSIINDYTTPVVGIECSSNIEVSYIEGDPGHRRLFIPIHRLNPKLEPGGIFDPRINEWLVNLGGAHYETLLEWLSHVLDVKRGICALNLYGSPGTGKGMLAAGLAECFEGEHRNDGRALGKFNVGLIQSPIVNCDEGVPRILSDEALSVDQAFRTMVTGGRLTIRAMHRDPFTAEIYPRILFTSNDRDIIRSIVGHRDLTPDDIRAIELRLLSIQVDDAALRLLSSRGNYSYTSGWIAGKERSKYIIANHIYYLYCNRVQRKGSNNRLLVEGDVHTPLVKEMRLRSRGAQAVLRALIKMLESSHQGARRGLYIRPDGRVWVTASAVLEFIENGFGFSPDRDMTLPNIGRVLRQFSMDEYPDDGRLPKQRPSPEVPRGRWVEIDLGLLLEEGLRYGLPNTQVMSLLAKQPDGIDAITHAMQTSQLEPVE